MPGKRSNIVCSRCKEKGGFLQKRWVKRTVNIPKKEKITSVPEAWDYAARVFLRKREFLMLYPPPFASTQDENISRAIYEHVDFGQLSTEEMREFELKHMTTPAKNIERKKKELITEIRRTTQLSVKEEQEGETAINKLKPFNTVHTRLRSDSGRITKSSVSCLYAAIICLTLRDICTGYPLPTEIDKEYAYAIYTTYSILEDDDRYAHPLPKWIKIIQDIDEYGYRKAAEINAKDSHYCHNCSSRTRNTLVLMEEVRQENYTTIKKCPKCGCQESLKRRLTIKHLRNKYRKILMKVNDISYYIPLFQKVRMGIRRYILSQNKKYFITRFKEHELLANKDLLVTQEYYFIGHYDPAKKTRRRWCPINETQLASVEISDARYLLKYKPLIKEIVNVYNNCSEVNQLELLDKASNLLQEIGWPQSFIRDKISADLSEAVTSIISVDPA